MRITTKRVRDMGWRSRWRANVKLNPHSWLYAHGLTKRSAKRNLLKLIPNHILVDLGNVRHVSSESTDVSGAAVPASGTKSQGGK